MERSRLMNAPTMKPYFGAWATLQMEVVLTDWGTLKQHFFALATDPMAAN
jgi:hypothetical protein